MVIRPTHTEHGISYQSTERHNNLSKSLALLLPLVDLLQERHQNFLNSFAWLGLDVGDQLIVALPLILVKCRLEYKNGKRMSIEIECNDRVSVSAWLNDYASVWILFKASSTK